MTHGMSLKRVLLQTVVGTLVLAALVGIYVFLFGDFGETEAKILGTTLTISAFSLTSLACAAAHEQRRHPLLSIPGLGLAVVWLLLYIPAIWAEWFDTEAVGKTMAIVGLFSFSLAQACLLSLATLQRHVAWVFYAAVTAILLLATIISGIIVFDPHDEEWIMRTVGVVAILDGCFSLCVPILHKLGGQHTVSQTAVVYQQIELVCPRCGDRGTSAVGEIACRKCSLTIRVQVGEG